MMPGRPIRILQFINSLGRGGAEKQLAETVAPLHGDEFQFHVCCLSAKGPFEEPLRAVRVPIEVLGYRGLRDAGRLRVSHAYEPLRMVRAFRKVVDRVRPDIVHTWIPVCNVIGGVALMKKKYRHIPLISSRVFTGEYRDAQPILAFAEDYAGRRSDLIYCNAQAVMADTIRREPKRDPAIMRVINNGVDLERFAPATDRAKVRERLGLAADVPVVICVAALRWHKGHPDLIRASASILKKHPNARFLLAGGDQGEGEKIKSFASDLGVASAFDFLGSRADVPDLLRAADVFAFPSHQEGLPNALLEAQASGLPCVATALPGCKEALADGETGMLVDIGDWESLAESISKLLSGSELRKALGAAARRRMESEYSQEAMNENFRNLYREAFALKRV
jgi:glycosyltransferase involved in cell wall biosynthesis